MRIRLKNKTEDQIDLDRKLAEAAGSFITYAHFNGVRPKPNLAEIKMLVKSGATVDHWVQYNQFSYNNAIRSAVINDSIARLSKDDIFDVYDFIHLHDFFEFLTLILDF